MAESGTLAERRRLEIIEAAERCVLRTGFHQLTLRDIAREHGGSLGNIYNYFANKEAIIEALVEREAERFIRLALVSGRELSTAPTLGERLRAHMTAFVDAYLDSEGARVAVSIAAEALINDRVRSILVRVNRRLLDVVIENVLHNREHDWEMPRSMLEAQLALSRSLLEGLRITVLFNPDIDRSSLRQVAIDRLTMSILSDLSRAQGIPPDELAKLP